MEDSYLGGNTFKEDSFKTLLIDKDKFIINYQTNKDSNNFWLTIGKLKT